MYLDELVDVMKMICAVDECIYVCLSVILLRMIYVDVDKRLI